MDSEYLVSDIVFTLVDENVLNLVKKYQVLPAHKPYQEANSTLVPYLGFIECGNSALVMCVLIDDQYVLVTRTGFRTVSSCMADKLEVHFVNGLDYTFYTSAPGLNTEPLKESNTFVLNDYMLIKLSTSVAFGLTIKPKKPNDIRSVLRANDSMGWTNCVILEWANYLRERPFGRSEGYFR